MREDLPSATALSVAFIRAFASRDPELSRACSDPCAEALLPAALQRLLRTVQRQPGSLAARALRTLSLGLYDHLALRTGLIDGAATRALAQGIDSVVLLGAGLDARAHRMPALESAIVYEVDHPATQAAKRERAQQLPRRARELRYVACDFERTELATALAEAGFDPTRRTLWIWEGVIMYLPERVVATTLRSVARLSAEGSLLVATYLTPELVAGGPKLGAWSARALGLVSEPFRCALLPEQMAALLEREALEVLSDAAPTDAAPHFGIEVTRPTSLMPKERIVVAIKRGKQS